MPRENLAQTRKATARRPESQLRGVQVKFNPGQITRVLGWRCPHQAAFLGTRGCSRVGLGQPRAGQSSTPVPLRCASGPCGPTPAPCCWGPSWPWQ